MSETVMLTSNPYADARQAASERGGTVGFPLPGVGVRVQRRQGQGRCPPARSAASRSRAPTSSRATGACPRRRPTSSPPTCGSRPATWARSTSDGYVTIVGRSKDLIISGGYNVYPAEIEGYINEHARRGRKRGGGRAAPRLRRSRGRVVVPKPGATLDAARSLPR
jgi:malonyl-CoA/methylmalonyl-CoA synthetase